MASLAQPESKNSEWLETDGLGGFASGTAGGIRTRRYHALLLVATAPPLRRMVLVNGADAELETGTQRYALSTQRYAPNVNHPDGIDRLQTFDLAPWPRWTYAAGEGRVVHELFVPKDRTAVVLRWRWEGPAPAAPLRLHVRPFFSAAAITRPTTPTPLSAFCPWPCPKASAGTSTTACRR
ncbi:MAG: glycogen debranching enzyme N-terminal domain-containing protein [Verrucomicrobiota bacterium]